MGRKHIDEEPARVTGPHSYAWHVSRERMRVAKKRETCTHERVVTFCLCCKLNMATRQELQGKDYGAKRLRLDRE